MTHTVTLTENDHITFQLFDASTNALKIRNRRKSLIYLISFGVLILLFGYTTENNFLMYYGCFFSILALVFGNTYLKWRHKRHYTAHTRNYRKDVGDEIVNLEILEDVIKMTNRTGESILKISEFQLIDEIPQHYFIKIGTGPTLIVPKTDIALNEEIKEMIVRYNIPHLARPDWKWN